MPLIDICYVPMPSIITITFNELSANVLQDLHSSFFIAKHVVEP